MNAILQSSREPGPSAIDAYEFFLPPSGDNYCHPVAFYTTETLHIDDLYDAYLEWCEVQQRPVEWVLSPATATDDGRVELNIHNWRLVPKGANSLLQIAEDSLIEEISMTQDLVQVFVVTESGAAELLTPLEAGALRPQAGVLVLHGYWASQSLVNTFEILGLSQELSYDATNKTLATTFDVVMAPLPEGLVLDADLSTPATLTMVHPDVINDHIDELLARHTQEDLSMTEQDTPVDETTTPELPALDTESGFIASPAIAANTDNAPSWIDAAAVEPAAVEVSEVIEPAATAEVVVAPSTGFIESTAPSFIDSPASAPNPPVTVGKNAVDVSCLLTNDRFGHAADLRDKLPRQGSKKPVPERLPPRKETQPQPQAQNPPRRKEPEPVAITRNTRAVELTREFVKEIQIGEDGVDHINVSLSAGTLLGKFLEINEDTEFLYGDLGWFRSVGAVWVYLRSTPELRTDDMRNLARGAARREVVRQLEESNRARDVVGLPLIIADATWVKINTYEQMKQEMLNSTLPFKLYHPAPFKGGVPTVPSMASWYLPVLEECRRTLKEIEQTGQQDLVPNFAGIERFGYSEKRNAKPQTHHPRHEPRSTNDASTADRPQGKRHKPSSKKPIKSTVM